ncbi:hypothetical protein [Dyella telluris]|uniref:Nitrogen fixation protein FixH n=1 Tax=Dyella telluris TaxID=2763498 RepID=A0A7G8PZT6_9GAMM|nr:hypothetical protein [Dyella telluris]QNK00044.1 hypothetical protein H8F01_12980 [Dyella telluris]
MTQTRSTWREPMVWLLVGLPLASVAIGFALLFAAVHPGQEDMETVGRVTRVGKLLVAAEDRELPAQVATKGLVLRIKGDMIEAVPMDGDFPRGGKLRLTITSSEPANHGQVIQLSPSELGWRGVGSLDGGHDWLVELRPENAAWLLRGHWAAQARFARLTP